MYFKGQFILIFKVLHFIYFQIGPESHHASDIDVVLYQPISQPLKFSEDLLMNIETQQRLNYFKTFVGFEKLTSVYSVVYLKELEDGIQYKTNICIYI